MENQPSVEERMDAYLAHEDAAQTTPEPTASDEVVSDSESENAVEAAEETADEAPKTAADDTPPEKESEDDAVAIEVYSELAEHLGVDIAELYEISVPTTGADGSKVNVSVGVLKDAYQDNVKAAKTIKAAQEEYEALNEQRTKMEASMQRQAAEAATFIKAVSAELTQEFNAVDWEGLKASDPGQYAARRQDFIERNGKLQSMQHQAGQQWEAQRQQADAQRQEQFGEYAQREQVALHEAIPEWRNAEAAIVEKQQVSEYLLDHGYNDDEVANAYDHRAIVLARKAMMWDESQAKASVATKRVLKIGKKILKPGARQGKADQKQDATRGLRQRLKKSGRVDDAVALYQALGG